MRLNCSPKFGPRSAGMTNPTASAPGLINYALITWAHENDRKMKVPLTLFLICLMETHLPGQ
jgi:hypothetical protein